MYARDLKLSNCFEKIGGWKDAVRGKMLANTAIGIEIELEGFGGVRPVPEAYWRIEGDGSLRNHGREYVLKRPLRGEKVTAALEALRKTFVKYEVKPNASHRTSVHIHIDCIDMTFGQAGKYALGLVMFEKVMLNWVDNRRTHNPYCVPIGNDALHVEAISRFIHDKGRKCDEGRDNYAAQYHLNAILDILLQEDARYSTINLCSLKKYGSIEIRMLEGTYDVQRLTEWINLLIAIKLWAKRMDTEDIQMLFDNFSAVNTDQWLLDNLGVEAANILADVPDKDAALLDGLRNAQDILHFEKELDEQLCPKGKKPFIHKIGKKAIVNERPKGKPYNLDALKKAHAILEEQQGFEYNYIIAR